MGNARWSAMDWAQHTEATAGQSRTQIFTQSGIHPSLDPRRIQVRESLDSLANPRSTPIIIGVDETGSMGELAEIIIKHGLGTIMQEIYSRKPVTDPHIMCLALGDTYSDAAPLQATQFEASIVLAEQVKNFYLEGNGGPNAGESYTFAWWFAAHKTRCDAILKRHRKGYLFTIGDECPLSQITRAQVKTFTGVDPKSDVQTSDLLALVSKTWNVFHLIVSPVISQPVVQTWRSLLQQRAIEVSDHNRLAEVIISIIQIVEGYNTSEVVSSWKGGISDVVRHAVGSLRMPLHQADSPGVVRL